MAPQNYLSAIKVLEVIKKEIWLQRGERPYRGTGIWYNSFFEHYGLTPTDVEDGLRILKAHGTIAQYAIDGGTPLGVEYDVRITPSFGSLYDSFLDKIYKQTKFDSTSGTLHILGVAIDLHKDQLSLMTAIFSDRAECGKEWDFSEIAEKTGDWENTALYKKFYNAAYQVQQKILRETGIADFFFLAKTGLTINPRYLK